MATALEELQRINKAQGALLNQRPNLNTAGAVPRRPPVASGLERVLKQPGEIAAKATTARGLGELARSAGDVLTGGPILRAGSQVLEQVQPSLQQFSAGLTGREPGQPAANIVQPPQVGAITPDAIQAIPQETQPVLPTTGAGVGTRAAPVVRGGAENFLNTVAGNRQAVLDAGGIGVIRGTTERLETPFFSGEPGNLTPNRLGGLSFSATDLEPGGLPGRERIASAGGSPALAQSIEASQGNVEAARLRAGGAVAAAGVRAAGGAQDQGPTTDAGIVEQINFRLATGTDAEGNPLDETSIATLLANKKRIQLNNPSLALQ